MADRRDCREGHPVFADGLGRKLTLILLWLALGVESMFLHFGVEGRAG